jgi:hypothetical protein
MVLVVLALVGCGAESEPQSKSAPEPLLAGTWQVSYRHFSGGFCSGTLTMTGKNSDLRGAIDVNDECQNVDGDTLHATTIGWNGAAGVLAGWVERNGGAGSFVVLEGSFDRDSMSFTIANDAVGGYVGAYLAAR